jgi:hypothetical protein
MLLKIPEGTWCRYYDHNGSNTHFIASESYGLLIDETVDDRNQSVLTVLMGNNLYEISKEEVCHC